MRTNLKRMLLIAAGIAGIQGAAWAGQDVAVTDLPEAVTKAIKEKYPEAQIVAAEKEREGGKDMYEVKLRDGDKHHEVDVTPDGKIVKVDADRDSDDVAIDALPAAVTKAIKDKFPGAELISAEKDTRGGQSFYEVKIRHEGKRHEVDVTAEGKVLKSEVDD